VRQTQVVQAPKV